MMERRLVKIPAYRQDKYLLAGFSDSCHSLAPIEGSAIREN